MKNPRQPSSTASRQEIAVQFLLYSALTVVGLVVGALIPNLGLWGATVVVLASIVLVLATAAVVSTLKNRDYDKRLEDSISAFTARAASVLDRYHITLESKRMPWLVSQSGLIAKEATEKIATVITVSQTLENDIPQGLFFETVSANLKRGVEYTYIYPQSPATNAKAKELVDVFPDYIDKLNLLPMPQKVFVVPLYTNLVAYITEEGSDEVYVELPVTVAPENRYWARVEKQFSYDLIGRLREFVDDYKRSNPDAGLL